MMKHSSARSSIPSPSLVPMGTVLLVCLLSSALLAASPAQGLTEDVLTLRNRALGELENEQPVKAEELFRQLADKVPGDPLPWANLAIALLRQQKLDAALEAITTAQSKAPGRPDLLAIQAEVLQWSGRETEALALLERAARRAPDDLEILFALYRLASTLGTDDSAAAEGRSLERLAELRPENVVVLSAQGRRAIAAGDKTAATGAYLRLGELTWQGPAAVEQLMDRVMEALKGDDLSAARVPAQRLENVLKVTPMYQQSLRELTLGIQGVPVLRFLGEPEPRDFGEAARVSFRVEVLADAPSPATAAPSLVVVDLDGDETPDPARLTVTGEGGAGVEVRLSSDQRVRTLAAPPAATGLLAADVDNDGHRDLLAHGPRGSKAWKGDGQGGFTDATGDWGLAPARGRAAAVLDFDIEGDLDLALVDGPGQPSRQLWRNALQGELQEVGEAVFPQPSSDAQGEGRQLLASDLDRDGDVDLLAAGPGGLVYLDNLRQGRFAERTAAAGLDTVGDTRAAVSADFDNDGRPDLVTAEAGGGLLFLRNQPPGSFGPTAAKFSPWPVTVNLPASFGPQRLVALDADHDGRLDLAVAGSGGVAVLAQRGDRDRPRFEPLEITGTEDALAEVSALAAADLDGDGDLDLLAGGEGGLWRLINVGGNAEPWLQVRLRGLDTGNSKNNLFGVGSWVEVFAGAAYQFREADGGVVHFGLGSIPKPDLLRVTWTNGVPQNRLQPESEQRIVEEQLLKGSCPFLYAWNGEEYTFVTDLLWGSPLGLPVAPGVWAGADPSELVRVDGLVPDDRGTYRLMITEELWEAAFFDLTRLWVVDHPVGVEVASDLRIVPGAMAARAEQPDRILASRDVRPLAGATDGRGRDVTDEVARRDEIYADGYRPSPYQGLAAEPWTFTLDLGEAPAAPVRLLLDGWIFPTDASLNLALAQRGDLAWMPPRLEVETADGWRTLMENPGFPAGKTKTLVIDTPPLPEGARRLRLVTTLWLHWDRVAWTTSPADDGPQAPRVVAKLDPETAELAYRGFSEMVRRAPNAPHEFDFQRVSTESPWRPFPGPYTRYGAVGELLTTVDDRSVILAAGDALELTFPAGHLPPPPEGWQRTVFLESHGWDKDADKNTYRAEGVEPLPFRAMSGYPWGPDENYPDTPELRRYREEWLTRVVD